MTRSVVRSLVTQAVQPPSRPAQAAVVARRCLVAAAWLVAIVVPGALRSQQGSEAQAAPYRPDALGIGQFATRADLERIAAAGGAAGAKAQQRLTNGDFQVGDRIALTVQGESALTDTVTVREGQVVHLDNLTDVSLHGVLHSELQARLAQEIARYLRNPVVRATPLVRVAVLGQVQRPGYYSAPADALVSDMLMRAGGPTTSANVNKTVVRRGPDVVLPAKAVETAMARGETIDQLDLRPGDQLIVPERPAGGNALRILEIVGVVAGIGTSIAIIATR